MSDSTPTDIHQLLEHDLINIDALRRLAALSDATVRQEVGQWMPDAELNALLQRLKDLRDLASDSDSA
jgi:hypothetical protein